MIMADAAAMLAEKRHFLIFDETPLFTFAFHVQTNNTFQTEVDINHHPDTDIVPLIEKFREHLNLSGFTHTPSQIINNIRFPIQFRDSMNLCPDEQAPKGDLLRVLLPIIVLDEDSPATERLGSLMNNLLPIS
jgi:hypothetical protein